MQKRGAQQSRTTQHNAPSREAARYQTNGADSRLGLGQQGGDFVFTNADEIAAHGRMMAAHGANGDDRVDRAIAARPGDVAGA
ncbi:hypothetical protein PT2222_170136 [Paraburkholderia tropica]